MHALSSLYDSYSRSDHVQMLPHYQNIDLHVNMNVLTHRIFGDGPKIRSKIGFVGPTMEILKSTP